MLRLAHFLAAIFICTATAHAQSGKIASDAELLAGAISIAPGKSFTVALQLAHPEEWHSYYKNSGGVELPPSIEWELPAGFTAGPIQWPVPEVKDSYFGKNFVYPGSPVFLIDITAPASLKVTESVTLNAKAKWQICKDSCINEEKFFTLVLPVTASGEIDPANAPLIEKTRSSLPARISSLEITAQSDGGDIQLRIAPASAIKGNPTDFIPNQPFLHPASAGGSIQRDGDAWQVNLKRIKIDAFDKPVPQGNAISGILAGSTAVEIPDTTIGSPPAK